MRVVICGGGVIGACTAYFLRRHGIDAIVVERTEVAAAASGKAGGFLAQDWCAGTSLDALARRSFALHAQLPEEIAGDWGYRPMTAYSGFVATEGTARKDAPSALGWLSNGVVITQRIGTIETTAIVHPRKFTSAVMNAALAQGAELYPGRVTGIVRDGDHAAGVEIEGTLVEANAVVIAMGPWSLLASQWTSLPAVYGQRSPSIVYDTASDVPADALFLEYEEAGSAVSIEVFPRADGSTHITALSDIAALPLDPAAVTPDVDAIARLQRMSERLSPLFRPERIIAQQACFRPVTEDGLPLIGKVPYSEGLYVATGHNVWGILNAPATGEALAQLIAEGATREIDLSPFDPARLTPLDPSLLQAR
ncbi:MULTISPECIES: FAD-dependent oxidoreductase [unclassified Bradyrhizobium]|uniref:NAD(P)/FAD-dependent oxidoreductase n=1 Tax=unclassified Bradyrhizobium TaxID=2631580 RepID=UPI001CD52984|nr:MULTISPECIES: FAD-dependent oxidoreductase [unclassified Bradyrhizobium]MCA1373558.1 FAD-binding oxidoreductase [Bradyrhizobium sp. IC4060]MCA1487201.1 FAD-binding oxidoreductase [Bradyrhizobium sp. IC4061]MCA1543828.1 FAD-binding oxidoreductase [Bradyrhizobium sp. NBAIM32]